MLQTTTHHSLLMVRLNNGATRPASPVIPNDTYVKRVVSSTEIELGQKATYSTKKLVGDRNGDARNLILTNKNFIAKKHMTVWS